MNNIETLRLVILNLLIAIMAIIYMSCNSSREKVNSQIILKYKTEMFLDLVDDNIQRLDKVGLASYTQVLNYLHTAKGQLLGDQSLIDSLYGSDDLIDDKYSFNKFNDHFQVIDSFRYSRMESIITYGYKNDNLDDHIINNLKNELKKSYTKILQMYMQEENLDIDLSKSFRIDLAYFYLSSILNITRGKRTGSNYAFYPKIEYGDIIFRNEIVTEIQIGVGVSPYQLDFEDDIVSMVIENDTIIFESSLKDIIYSFKDEKAIGDTIRLELDILNPLTGSIYKTRKYYIIK